MATLAEVEAQRDSCIQKFRTLDDLFEKPKALNEALDLIENNKPTIALTSPYFSITSHCSLKENAMQIQNDRNLAKVKGFTYHETIHFVLYYYILKKGKPILDVVDIPAGDTKELTKSQYFEHEALTTMLTDVALQDDKSALLEERWLAYKLGGLKHLTINLALNMAAGVPLGYCAGWFIGEPGLLAVVPAVLIINKSITSATNWYYKNHLRNKLLSLPAPEFKEKP